MDNYRGAVHDPHKMQLTGSAYVRASVFNYCTIISPLRSYITYIYGFSFQTILWRSAESQLKENSLFARSMVISAAGLDTYRVPRYISIAVNAYLRPRGQRLFILTTLATLVDVQCIL